MNQETGKIFVVSAPSGSGKNTVINKVMERMPKLRYSVSATTRGVRGDEVHGIDYYFISEREFDEMLHAGELLEHTGYIGSHYGTPEKPMRKLLEQGYDVVMDLDVVGGLTIKQKIPEAVIVFLAVPSVQELHDRLVARGTDSPEKIAERIAKAHDELPKAEFYDYIILNATGKLETAADELAAIITAEKYKADPTRTAAEPTQALALAENCRTAKRIDLIKEVLSCFTPQ